MASFAHGKLTRQPILKEGYPDLLKLASATLDWVQAYLSVFGDSNLMPMAFEYRAIAAEWPKARDFLSGVDVTNWNVRDSRRILAPKNRYGFRSVTQLDPFDFFIYAGLVYEAGGDIEAARLAAQNEISLSYRFLPTNGGQFFDPHFDFNRFQAHSRTLAQAPGTSHVVTADIADFFPRIYSHPLENALSEALPTKGLHASSLKRFLKQLNQHVSYGIPTGPDASFLLSELLLDVIDRGLLSEGVTHCRWADDFRIFCGSERDAYSRLNLLANLLFESFGLTLQQSKTSILPSEKFIEGIDRPSNVEVSRLSEQFDELLEALGLHSDFYEPISVDDLSPEQKAKLDALNLVELLEAQFDEANEGISTPVVRFLMWRLTQIGNTEALDLVLDRLEALYPVIVDVFRYIDSLHNLDAAQRERLRLKLLECLENSKIGDSQYLRYWILSILSKPGMLFDQGTLVRLFNDYPDEYSQRQTIIALGRAHAQSWIKPRKQQFSSLSPWLRRAFLAAASSLPGDEAENYYRSLRGRLDPLEAIVCDWAEKNSF